jgi:hypothetical protein
MRLDRRPDNVDLNLDIAQQPGLGFDINLNLQGDELHLSAGFLWLSWFPCDQPAIAAKYRDAVQGLISGRLRIVEHYRGSRPVKAELQEPVGDGWQTIGTRTGIPWPFSRRTTIRVLQNEIPTRAR